MSEGSRQLAAAWGALASQWLETRSHWRDAVALEFEGRCWNELHQQTQELLRAAERLENAFPRALRSTD
jgi:hypothetical protein